MISRRTAPVIVAAFIAAGLGDAASSAASPGLSAQREREHAVYAQVAAINARLDGVVQAWDGARVELGTVNKDFVTNARRLRAARANLAAARKRIEQRLVQLYTNPDPSTVSVIAGASSLDDLISRLEAVHVLTDQDSAIARQALSYQSQVIRTEKKLRRERRERTETVARLDARKRTIAASLATDQRLLASIHQSIQTLEAQQAARERELAAAEQARIARQAALAHQQAAAQAINPASNAVAPPDPPSTPQSGTTTPTTPPSTPSTSSPPSTTPPPSVVPSPGPTKYAAAATIAARYLGVPYRWGGESPDGFDCSGLVAYVYAQLGVSLPHYTVAQWNATEPIPVSDLEPGDLVFFNGLGHVGIYIGNGQFIHAPETGEVVQVATLAGHWMSMLDGARRVR
jgi:peptidoglycan DL-endopeptidase CwlO